jgi:hypothetical protein
MENGETRRRMRTGPQTRRIPGVRAIGKFDPGKESHSLFAPYPPLGSTAVSWMKNAALTFPVFW